MDLKEIDFLVADEVLDWIYYYDKKLRAGTWLDAGLKRVACADNHLSPFSPSTNIQDAWLVVEKLKKDNTLININHHKNGYYADIWFKDLQGAVPYKDTYADTAPLAICLAALKSVGVEVEI